MIYIYYGHYEYHNAPLQTRAQYEVEVLDPSYIPTISEEMALFDEKLKYMYAVFEQTLLTVKGKALVRTHQKTCNAHSSTRSFRSIHSCLQRPPWNPQHYCPTSQHQT